MVVPRRHSRHRCEPTLPMAMAACRARWMPSWAIRAASEERARGTAKGIEFEDALAERLAALSRGTGDFLERTGTDAGDALRSKKGDFVLTIDPSRNHV